MASLDQDRKCVVIRVVYDGPSVAGKTTTMRSLAGSLTQSMFSAEEAEGRTLYFDWVDYVGGLFEGYPIRCQMVSVPGQVSLKKRRQTILDAADAVVFVADTTPDRFAESMQALASLRASLEAAPGPRVGLVVQANKRDVPGAVGLGALREALTGGAAVAVTESIATEGIGIRETFVFAVRLALDRVRELIRVKALPTGPPEIESGDDLLAILKAEEDRELAQGAAEELPAALALREALASQAEEKTPPGLALRGSEEQFTGFPSEESSPWGLSDRGAPWGPDPAVAGGLIWPPIEGRIFLHEAASSDALPVRCSTGDWEVPGTGPWRVYSYFEALYFELDEGRAALVEWAQRHAAIRDRLSPNRCVVLAEAASGAWRLWQVVRAERSLRDLLAETLASRHPRRVARGLLEGARLYLEAAGSLNAPPIAWTGDPAAVGPFESRSVFVGLMPAPGRNEEPSLRTLDPHELLRREWGPVLQAADPQVEVPLLLRELRNLADGVDLERTAETLTVLLIGH